MDRQGQASRIPWLDMETTSKLEIYPLSSVLIIDTCNAFDVADPSTYKPSKWPSSRKVSCSSVDKAPNNRYLGGHGFESCQGVRFFFCSTLVKNKNFIIINKGEVRTNLILSDSCHFHINVLSHKKGGQKGSGLGDGRVIVPI